MTPIAKEERAALDRIETLADAERLRAMISNARRLGSDVIERAAFVRLCLIQPEATPGTVEHDVWQSVHALEEMLADERGKTVRLSRTRQKIARDGEAKTCSDLTLKRDASAGFVDLLARGHAELTFEAVVLRHPKTFDMQTRTAARQRLAGAGVDPDQFEPSSEGA
ncbi:hypothetical protein [Wenxinia marina]|uniref:Uncharacterized protein n=1 Tax=Wenxinia marina DSM 24838 TaxID=1123501 RepID=A0A0D0QHP5_9RHOB|nr:hypothetical protein [Wenxinia marina]KIQ70598.1 hypothetical protein Wenmar_00976 [Wenxinia marina DSM 24838]GGL51818.1 hypothetical protein GCM10011392_02730 [Wenxinia marina]